jgi:CheY-like chemotaxis protein
VNLRHNLFADMLRERHILIVSGAQPQRALSASLLGNGFPATTVNSAERALDQLAVSHCDLVIVDLSTLDDAIDLIKRIRSVATLKQVPILMICEWGTGLLSLALSAGADACEPLPFSEARIIESVERLLHSRAATAGAGK